MTRRGDIPYMYLILRYDRLIRNQLGIQLALFCTVFLYKSGTINSTLSFPKIRHTLQYMYTIISLLKMSRYKGARFGRSNKCKGRNLSNRHSVKLRKQVVLLRVFAYGHVRNSFCHKSKKGKANLI